ncbi:phosphoribosylglycinamide synthetase, partial [Streptococcus mutans]|nr:phosphoribosylglycinamide synthetase [Streptococcus mutans]
MKMLKKILGCKIYIWFAALIALVGLFFYWYG